MKKHGGLIALGVAIGFGALAVIFTSRWIDSRGLAGQQAALPEPPLRTIVVAASDIETGTPLTATMLTETNWPKLNAPNGAFSSKKEVEGRVTKDRVVAGTPLLAAELAAPGSGAGLVALISHGKRAISIKVDEVIGVAGFVLPNSFVDVLGVETREDGPKGKANKVTTILEKIKVLAIAQETSTEEGKAKVVRTVTLEVSPSEGEKLALHTNNGVVHLTLRNPLDPRKTELASQEPTPSPPRTAKKGKASTPVAHRPEERPPEPKPFEVEVIKGKDRETINFKALGSAAKA